MPVRIGIVGLAVFLLDWASKHWIATHLLPGASITVIPGFFSLTLVENSGAAFGLLQRQTLLFVVIALMVVGLIVTYGRAAARRQPALGIALGLLLGGAVGNLVDRILHGRVIDFLDFHVWPFVFNFADAAIVIGGAIFAWIAFRETPPAGEGR